MARLTGVELATIMNHIRTVMHTYDEDDMTTYLSQFGRAKCYDDDISQGIDDGGEDHYMRYASYQISGDDNTLKIYYGDVTHNILEFEVIPD